MFIRGLGREEMINEVNLCASGSLAVSSSRTGRAPAAIQYDVGVVQPHSIRAGVMRVLGLGVDEKCAHIFQRMLEECVIQVEPCTGIPRVVERLMQKRHDFDIVLINGNHPSTSGAKVLRDVSTKMDIPVIIMSGEDVVAMLIRGRVHLVLELYIKEVLWGLWQDVVRNRISTSSVDLHQTQNLKNGIEQQQKPLEADFDNKASTGDEVNLKSQSNSKRKGTYHPDGISPIKKQHLAWTPELHNLFLKAIAALGGLDKAVPNKIKEVMNVPGLTREHIASHLQKYRLSLKKQGKGRHETAVGHISQPSQPEPEVISQESQWKTNTATWNQQQQTIDLNERQQPPPSFPDMKVNVQMPPPLQSTEPAVTGNTGQLFHSDEAFAEMPFPGGNGVTDARIEESHNPIPHIPSQLDLPVSSQPEFRTEEPASADDFWDFQDWELPNLGVQFHGFQLEDITSYQPDENTGPNTGRVSNEEESIPFVNIPVQPETLPSPNLQSMPDDYFMAQDLDMFFPEDQGQGGGTGIHDDDWLSHMSQMIQAE